jgi:transposase
MSLYAKRLERGRFLWPSSADGVVTITPAQLGYLLEGIGTVDAATLKAVVAVTGGYRYIPGAPAGSGLIAGI